jgi:hypothetical protein
LFEIGHKQTHCGFPHVVELHQLLCLSLWVLQRNTLTTPQNVAHPGVLAVQVGVKQSAAEGDKSFQDVLMAVFAKRSDLSLADFFGGCAEHCAFLGIHIVEEGAPRNTCCLADVFNGDGIKSMVHY